MPGRGSRLGGAGGRRLDGRQRVNLHLLEAARVRVENLELEAARMADDLATHRHAPEQREHQAAERVDVLFILGLQELDAEMLLELLDRRARQGDDADL